MDSKDTDASQASPFKNVFDSLTLFEDSPQHGDAGQEHGGLPHSSTLQHSSSKKTQPESSGAGTEDAIVLQAPARSATKPSLVLSLSAIGAASESGEALDDEAPEGVPTPQVGNSSEQSDASSSQATKSQAAPIVQQAQVPPSVSASPQLAAAPATKAIPAKVVEATTTSATAKALFTAPPAPESVPAQPVQGQPVQTKPVQETAIPVQTAQAGPTLPATLPIYQLHQPTATVRPSTSLPVPQATSASAPKSSPTASSFPVRTPEAAAPARVETSQSYPVSSNPPVSNAPQAVARARSADSRRRSDVNARAASIDRNLRAGASYAIEAASKAICRGCESAAAIHRRVGAERNCSGANRSGVHRSACSERTRTNHRCSSRSHSNSIASAVAHGSRSDGSSARDFRYLRASARGAGCNHRAEIPTYTAGREFRFRRPDGRPGKFFGQLITNSTIPDTSYH